MSNISNMETRQKEENDEKNHAVFGIDEARRLVKCKRRIFTKKIMLKYEMHTECVHQDPFT